MWWWVAAGMLAGFFGYRLYRRPSKFHPIEYVVIEHDQLVEQLQRNRDPEA